MANIVQTSNFIVTYGVVPEFGLEDSEGLLANSYSQQANVQKYEQPNSASAPRGVIYYGQALSATISGAVPASESSGEYTMVVGTSVVGEIVASKIFQSSTVPFLACVMTNANLDTSVLNNWLVNDEEATFTSYCEASNDSRNVGQPHNRDYSMTVYPF